MEGEEERVGREGGGGKEGEEKGGGGGGGGGRGGRSHCRLCLLSRALLIE